MTFKGIARPVPPNSTQTYRQSSWRFPLNRRPMYRSVVGNAMLWFTFIPTYRYYHVWQCYAMVYVHSHVPLLSRSIVVVLFLDTVCARRLFAFPSRWTGVIPQNMATKNFLLTSQLTYLPPTPSFYYCRSPAWLTWPRYFRFYCRK
jgi:hypothetical protein